MRKTTLVVNDALVEQASKILGTHGLKDTIDRALTEVLAIDARRQAIRQLREMDGLDLDQSDIMDQAWR